MNTRSPRRRGDRRVASPVATYDVSTAAAIPDVTLRPRRQLTLPAEACDALGLEIGDRFEISLTDGGVYLRPRKAIALDSLREIRRVFQESGLTEGELQAEGRRVRERLSRARYGSA